MGALVLQEGAVAIDTEIAGLRTRKPDLEAVTGWLGEPCRRTDEILWTRGLSIDGGDATAQLTPDVPPQGRDQEATA